MNRNDRYVYEGFKAPSTDPLTEDEIAWIHVLRSVAGDAAPPPTLADVRTLRMALTGNGGTLQPLIFRHHADCVNLARRSLPKAVTGRERGAVAELPWTGHLFYGSFEPSASRKSSGRSCPLSYG